MEEGRLSILWVHGNTNATTPTITAETDFNVDQPVFWTPLSVLSGLASGYCERRAVLNSTFVTGASTSLIWNQSSTESTDVAARETIVKNCMNNMALGSPLNKLFYNSNAMMAPIGSAADTTTNYMTVMDSAINEMIDANTTPHYVDSDGVDYTGFTGVATRAVTTAAAANSAIQTPTSGGGTALKSTLGPGLPVEWAKQRKWMLDELQWTEGGVATNQVLINGAWGSAIEIDSDYTAAVSGQNLYSAAVVAGNAVEYDDYRLGVYWVNSSSTEVVSAYPIAYVYSAGVMAASPTTEGVATVYFGKISERWNNSMTQIDYTEYTDVTGASIAEDNGAYSILTGGTLTIPTNVDVDRVTIESGGTLQMAGGSVGYVNVMDGGVYLPNIVLSGGVQYVDSYDFRVAVYQNYTAPTERGYNGLYPGYGFTHMQYIKDVTNTDHSVRNVYVTGTTAAGSVYISGNLTTNPTLCYGVAAPGGKITVSGTLPDVRLIVSSGGSVEIGSGVQINQLYIASGGKATLHANWVTPANYTMLCVHSGGSLTLDGTPNSTRAYMNLNIEDGAYFHIPAAAHLYKVTVTHNHYDRPTSSFTCYTFKTPTELVNSMGTGGNIMSGYNYFGSANLCQFNNFGLSYATVNADQTTTEHAITEGWNNIPCSAILISDNDYYVVVAGVATATEGRNKIKAANVMPHTPVTSGASGTITYTSATIVATTDAVTQETTYTTTTGNTETVDSFPGLLYHDCCDLLNTMYSTAWNKLRGAQSHYKEFYVRQSSLPGDPGYVAPTT